LKFYRVGISARDTELMHIKDSYGVTDLECVDFNISENNRFILCVGREGTVKIFDYFMRGDVIPSSQAFMGHFKYATKVILSKDMRFIFSVGELNGIFKWQFYGDKSMPEDITEYFEELESEKLAKAALTEEEKEKQRANEGIFDQEELASYTQQQIEN
jgi:WD40 repeat protein